MNVPEEAARVAEDAQAKVSVLGLGAMGGVIARGFADAGCEVTVWNRSPERADALAANGCRVATSPADAITASTLTVLCVADADAVDEVLSRAGVRDVLAGRVVANLTTIASGAQIRARARIARRRARLPRVARHG